MKRVAQQAHPWIAFAIFVILEACGSAAESKSPITTQPATEATQSGRATAGTSGDVAAPSGGAGGMSDDSDEPGVPCDAFKALANACHRCHGPVPANGAPMSLVTLPDFQVLTVQTPKIPKYQQARERMDGTKGPRMPPPGLPITDEDKKTLIDWLGKGAPAADGDAESCP